MYNIGVKQFADFIFFQEGRISKSLISNGIMYRQPCRDTENKKEQFTYRVGKNHSHTKSDRRHSLQQAFHTLLK